MKIERIRYVILTINEEKIFCGTARNYDFKNVSEIKNASIKTYCSEKKAMSSFLRSWYNADKSDFEDCGRFKVKQILETLVDNES